MKQRAHTSTAEPHKRVGVSCCSGSIEIRGEPQERATQTDRQTRARGTLVHGERPFGLANREREGEGLIACCRPGDLHAERHYKSGRQVMNAAARYSSSPWRFFSSST